VRIGLSKINADTCTNAHGLGNRELAALGAYFFLYFGGVAFNVTFLPIFLKARGLSLSEMAVLWALAATAGGITQARIGHWSDSIGSRKSIAAAGIVLLSASYLFYDLAHTFWQFVPLYLWSGLCLLIGFTLPQAIISDWTSASRRTAHGFSITRIWGTVGFIVALVMVTAWPGIAGGVRFLYWVAGLYAASAVPLLLVREGPIKRTDHSLLRGAARVLRSDRSWVFLICFVAFRLTETGMLNYTGLYLKGLGADARVIASAYWICAVAEVPIVLTIGRISDRIGRKLPLMIAFAVWPARLYAYSLISAPTSIFYIQLLHGFTFGIVLICSVAYMSDVAPDDLRGTAQGLLNTGNAVAMALGPLLTGFLGDAIGLAAAFRVMAGMMVIGFVALAVLVREPVSVL